jgi:hypothetical protein
MSLNQSTYEEVTNEFIKLINEDVVNHENAYMRLTMHLRKHGWTLQEYYAISSAEWNNAHPHCKISQTEEEAMEMEILSGQNVVWIDEHSDK